MQVDVEFRPVALNYNSGSSLAPWTICRGIRESAEGFLAAPALLHW